MSRPAKKPRRDYDMSGYRGEVPPPMPQWLKPEWRHSWHPEFRYYRQTIGPPREHGPTVLPGLSLPSSTAPSTGDGRKRRKAKPYQPHDFLSKALAHSLSNVRVPKSKSKKRHRKIDALAPKKTRFYTKAALHQ
jgi:hypothetical protein